MKKSLITGGAGFVGSNLAWHLVKTGKWQVDIVDNLSNGHYSFIKHLPGDKLICDFVDDMVLDRIRNQRYDTVFHQAAVPRVEYSIQHPSRTTQENLAKTVALLEACKGNIQRFVFASSSSVYGNVSTLPTPEEAPKEPRSFYALQKLSSERFIKLFCDLYDMDIVCLRYFNVFGMNSYGGSPYSTLISAWCDAIKNGKPLRSDGSGNQSRDLCFIENVTEANLLAAEVIGSFNGEAYNIGCQQQTTNNEILEYFKKRFPGIEVVNAPERPGDVKHTCADISVARRILGYEPKVKFWEGLERTIEWWGL